MKGNGVRVRTRMTAVAVTLAALLVAGLLPATAATPEQCADAPPSDFTDRDDAREAHQRSIDCVDHAGISRGFPQDDGTREYRPLEEVARAQMASFIIQTLIAAGYEEELPSGEATEDDPDEFSDISESVHRERINQLARIDVARGTGGDRYRPGRDINRMQMATFIVAAAEWALQEDYRAEGDHFEDVSRDNPHHGNINAGFEQELFSGTTPPQPGVERSGRFSPRRDVLRDQMASFLTNLLAHTEV